MLELPPWAFSLEERKQHNRALMRVRALLPPGTVLVCNNTRSALFHARNISARIAWGYIWESLIICTVLWVLIHYGMQFLYVMSFWK